MPLLVTCRSATAGHAHTFAHETSQNGVRADLRSVLLPPDMRDWLPADHLVWFVLDVVDRLDLGAFRRSYRSSGLEATAPRETAVQARGLTCPSISTVTPA
jgi:hypothetical protein